MSTNRKMKRRIASVALAACVAGNMIPQAFATENAAASGLLDNVMQSTLTAQAASTRAADVVVTTWAELKSQIESAASGSTKIIEIGADITAANTQIIFGKSGAANIIVTNPNGHVIYLGNRAQNLYSAGGTFPVRNGAKITLHNVKLDGQKNAENYVSTKAQSAAGVSEIYTSKSTVGLSLFVIENGTLDLTGPETEVYNFQVGGADSYSSLFFTNSSTNDAIVNIRDGKYYNNTGRDGVIGVSHGSKTIVNFYGGEIFNNFTREESLFDSWDNTGASLRFWGGSIHDNYGTAFTYGLSNTVAVLFAPDENSKQQVDGKYAFAMGNVQVYDNYYMRNLTSHTIVGVADAAPSNMGADWNFSHNTNASDMLTDARNIVIKDQTDDNILWIASNSYQGNTDAHGIKARFAITETAGYWGVPVAHFSDRDPNDGIADGVYSDYSEGKMAALHGKFALVEAPELTSDNMLYLTNRVAELNVGLYQNNQEFEHNNVYPMNKTIGLQLKKGQTTGHNLYVTAPEIEGKEAIYYTLGSDPTPHMFAEKVVDGEIRKVTETISVAVNDTVDVKIHYNLPESAGVNVDIDGDGIPDVNIDTDNDGKPDLNLDPNVPDNLGSPNANENGLYFPNYTGTPELNVDTNGTGTWKPSGSQEGSDEEKAIWSPDKNIDTDGDGVSNIDQLDKDAYPSKPGDLHESGVRVDDYWKPAQDITGEAYADKDMETGDPTTNRDTDGDGKPDLNVDIDGDGIPDVNIDTDGDGKADLNLDPNIADNIGNAVTDENGTTSYPEYIENGHEPEINVDTNGTGTWKPSGSQEGSDEEKAIWSPDKNIDTDGDGAADIDQLDKDAYPSVSDGSGSGNRPSVDESWKPQTPITGGDYDGKNMETGDPTLNKDTDGDGKPDLNIDVDGDGIPDVNIDTDNDGKADLNLDPDASDNLGQAVTNPDTGKDSYPQYVAGGNQPDLNVDTNGTGTWKPSGSQEGSDAEKGVWSPDKNIDTNGDGVADIGQLDKDAYPSRPGTATGNRPAVDEQWKPETDITGNGYEDENMETGDPTLNYDKDGDGIPDINIDVDGDGIPDVNVDSDKDGKPDINIDPDYKDNYDEDQPNKGLEPELNIDTDGTGTWKPSGDKDSDDGIWRPDTDLDTNGDGKADTDYPGEAEDADGNGIDDSWENAIKDENQDDEQKNTDYGETGDPIGDLGIVVDPSDDMGKDVEQEDGSTKRVLILRGTWADEKTHTPILIDRHGRPVDANQMTWSINPNHEEKYGFKDAAVSVDANTGLITVQKSGIVEVTGKYKNNEINVVVIVPGDYDRDGFTVSTDIGYVSKLAARKSGVEDSRIYSFELADLDRDEAIRSSDISDVSKIASRKYKF